MWKREFGDKMKVRTLRGYRKALRKGGVRGGGENKRREEEKE